MIDVVHQINSVARRVGTRELPAGQARTVVITRSYTTSVDDLWDACTNPERIPRWFLPISGDLRLGGRYQLEGQAGGTVERCDPPRSFAATWEFGGDVTWIELRLTAVSSTRTQLELEHIAHVDDARWAEFGPGAVGVGWDMGMIGLTLYLEGSGERVDPSAVAAWVASEEGKQFIRDSSEGWCEASIAAGTPADDARAAAARTTAAYTGT